MYLIKNDTTGNNIVIYSNYDGTKKGENTPCGVLPFADIGRKIIQLTYHFYAFPIHDVDKYAMHSLSRLCHFHSLEVEPTLFALTFYLCYT